MHSGGCWWWCYSFVFSFSLIQIHNPQIWRQRKQPADILNRSSEKPCCMCVTWSRSPMFGINPTTTLLLFSFRYCSHIHYCAVVAFVHINYINIVVNPVSDCFEKEASSWEDEKCKLYRHDPSLLQCRKVGRDIRGVDKDCKMGNMQKYHDTCTHNTRCCSFSLWHSIYSDNDASLITP